MAKPIYQSPPTSSVARFLNRQVASSAVSPAKHAQDDERLTDDAYLGGAAARERGRSGRHIKREFILAAQTDATFEELLTILRRSTRSRISASQVLRALLTVTGRALPAIEAEALRMGAIRMPGNGNARMAARIAFDERIADTIATALRQTVLVQQGAYELTRSRDRPGR